MMMKNKFGKQWKFEPKMCEEKQRNNNIKINILTD